MKTKKVIKFPSIEQFSSVVANINRHYNFVGLDDNGEAIYDATKPKPTVSFTGTCKLHGTNAAFSFNNVDGYWFQSRENIISIGSDNAVAAYKGEANKDAWMKLINQVKEENNVDLDNNSITIYYEWAGSGIQLKVGICNLEKSAFIIGAKVSPFEVEGLEKQAPAYWVECKNLRAPENRIYNINDYKTFSIVIDFNHPELSQNEIIEQTLSVEDECPVAKAFGFSNTIGEGVVYLGEYGGNRYLFKSKGLKHSGSSKVKTLKPVDNEKISKLIDIAESVTQTWRLDQMLTQACDLLNGGEIKNEKLGEFIKLVINDILKEELSVLAEAGVEPKEINKYVSDIARKFFFQRQNEALGLS